MRASSSTSSALARRILVRVREDAQARDRARRAAWSSASPRTGSRARSTATGSPGPRRAASTTCSRTGSSSRRTSPPGSAPVSYIGLIALVLALTLLHGWVRYSLLVPTLYLGTFVWENVLLAQPDATRYIVLGVMLIVLMIAAPERPLRRAAGGDRLMAERCSSCAASRSLRRPQGRVPGSTCTSTRARSSA